MSEAIEILKRINLLSTAFNYFPHTVMYTNIECYLSINVPTHVTTLPTLSVHPSTLIYHMVFYLICHFVSVSVQKHSVQNR